MYARFFNRAFESSSVWFAFGPLGFVSARVTLLSAVGLRKCGAASIGRKEWRALLMGALFKRRSGHERLHPDLIVHAGAKVLAEGG